jgi:hypothetical protein
MKLFLKDLGPKNVLGLFNVVHSFTGSQNKKISLHVDSAFFRNFFRVNF